MNKLLKYWKPQKNGYETWSTPKGGFNLFGTTKIYTYKKSRGEFSKHSFYQGGYVVYRDLSGEHRLYNVKLTHDT